MPDAKNVNILCPRRAYFCSSFAEQEKIRATVHHAASGKRMLVCASSTGWSAEYERAPNVSVHENCL